MRRRDFLRRFAAALASGGATATAGAAFAGSGPAPGAAPDAPRGVSFHPDRGTPPIAIQLYSLRTLMEHDPERVLAALASIGYREVELAGLFGRTPEEVRAMLDRTGLRAVAAHVGLADLEEGWDATRAMAEVLAVRYVVVPWIDERDRSLDGYRRIAARFDRAGSLARDAGLAFAYHNQAYEFEAVEGVIPYDLLLAETDPDLVLLELDVFWMRRGGRDPHAYFTQYPGRFPLVHVKDMDGAGRMVDVGAGDIDFAAIIASGERAGIRHYILEHDEPPAPLQFAESSFEHMRALLR